MLSKDAFTKNVAKRIKQTREEKDISQEELAHEAGLCRTYIGHLENARYSPSAYVLYKISSVLNIKTSDLLGL